MNNVSNNESFRRKRQVITLLHAIFIYVTESELGMKTWET
jgi:hypothetical protein